MSSVPTERRTLQPRTPMIRVDLRVLAVVAAACVGLFALSFLAGRALSPGRGGHSVALPEVAATQASGEIPVRLSVAPALKLATPVVTVLHTSAPKSSTTSPPSALPVLTQPSPAPPPAAPVVVQPPAAVTQPPAKTPVTPQSAPAAKSNSGGGSAAPKGGGGGGVSFDSSG